MKRLAVFFLFVAVSLFVRADYLYWTTQDSPSWAINGSGQFDFEWASVKLSETGETLKSRAIDPNGTILDPDDYWDAGGASMGATYFVDVTDLKGKSFYIEYYVYDSVNHKYNVTGMSQVETYDSLHTAGFIGQDMEYKPATDVWLGSGYMVPEPTGGVLLLMGLGLLGLRRRRNREVA